MNFVDRPAYLEHMRNRKMARSPEAFVRGTASRFYAWLKENDEALPQGPAIWICGDCHLGNLGALADLSGRVAIQIRDFDQTVIGNPAHDLVRLGLSLASAARGSGLPGVTTVHMLDNLLAGYIEAPSASSDAICESKDLRKLVKRAVRRRWHSLAMKRLIKAQGPLPRNLRFWPLHRQERAHVLAFCRDLDMAKLAPPQTDHVDRWKVIDAAYWIKGCSSLGHLRYAALFRGRHHHMVLLDIKEACKAAAPSAPNANMPRNQAERVLAGARALSPNLGDRIVCGHVEGRPVFVRALSPHDMKLEVGRLTTPEAEAIATHLGAIVGTAHRRQLDRADWRSWTEALHQSNGTASRSWLWASVVDLLADHDLAYLEHCRRFTLSTR